jgi:hypothetical protein
MDVVYKELGTINPEIFVKMICDIDKEEFLYNNVFAMCMKKYTFKIFGGEKGYGIKIFSSINI